MKFNKYLLLITISILTFSLSTNVYAAGIEATSITVTVFNVAHTFLTLIQFAVPLGLIFYISIDIFKGVINPEDKNGMKHIKNRLIAAFIVFLTPTLITGIFAFYSNVLEQDSFEGSTVYSAWKGSTSYCVENLKKWKNCDNGYSISIRNANGKVVGTCSTKNCCINERAKHAPVITFSGNTCSVSD